MSIINWPRCHRTVCKYLGVNQPFTPFYKGGLAAIDQAASTLHGKGFAQLARSDSLSLVTQMASGIVPGWEGPPPGFFFFVVRADAVDVRYGTPEGFAELGIPYMAHIAPPTQWGE